MSNISPEQYNNYLLISNKMANNIPLNQGEVSFYNTIAPYAKIYEQQMAQQQAQQQMQVPMPANPQMQYNNQVPQMTPQQMQMMQQQMMQNSNNPMMANNGFPTQPNQRQGYIPNRSNVMYTNAQMNANVNQTNNNMFNPGVRNNTPVTTSNTSGSSGKYSNANAAERNIITANNNSNNVTAVAPVVNVQVQNKKQVDEQVHKPVVEAKAITGNEFEFLTIPTEKNVKRLEGGYYRYEIIEKDPKEDKVNINEHAAVYDMNKHISVLDDKITDGITVSNTDDLNVKFLNKLIYGNTLNSLINDFIFVAKEENNDFDNLAVRSQIETVMMVDKITNAPTVDVWLDLIRGANNLTELVNSMRDKVESKQAITSKAFKIIAYKIGSILNTTFKISAGTKAGVEELINDFDELTDIIKSVINKSDRSTLERVIIDVFNYVKRGSELPIKTDKLYETGVRVGGSVFIEPVLLAYSKDQTLAYELTDANDVKYITIQNTPVLYNFIDTVFSKIGKIPNEYIVLIDIDYKQYKICKSKLNTNFTIIKIA